MDAEQPLCIDLCCGYCGIDMRGCRRDKKFCSAKCAQRSRNGHQKMPFNRNCRVCEHEFLVVTNADANRKYCSNNCAKRAYAKGIGIWKKLNPERVKQYQLERVKRNADVWKDQARSERRRILEMLGGKCIVCGVTNISWLHVDYIPTCRGRIYRHPRTLKYTAQNLHLFRLLCANHHYELTLTGKIEGTEIVQ
jgi:hypothetical protein